MALSGINLNPAVRNRILILDVERLDGITLQHYWDRGDLQKKYVHHETVIREPRTTIVCAKWYDSPDVLRFAEWDKGGRRRFLERVHALVNTADIIVGHNIDNADKPWLEGDFYFPRIGHPHRPNLPKLTPYKTVDTLKILRSFKSGVQFKSLDAFNQIVGIAAKTDRYDPAAMERAVTERSQEDRERLTDYCAGDVIATQGTYDYLRRHATNHPALFVDGESSLTTCNRCGYETEPIAKRWVANVLSYSMRRCTNCGAHSRISIEPERLSIVRGV